MQTRLRYTLPIVQVLLAIALLYVGHLHDRSIAGNEYQFRSTATRLCYAISAPASLLRFCGIWLWEIVRGSPNPGSEIVLDDVLFLLGVALVWYVVALNVESRRDSKRQVPATSQATAWRILRDLALIVIGMGLGILGIGARHHAYGQVVCSLYLAWGLTLVLSYGKDITQLLPRTHPERRARVT